MAKKRKADKSFSQPVNTKLAKHDIEERFDDSEDEFYAGRDKILLDETADSKRRNRLIETEKDLQPSDEEILGYEDIEEDEDLSEDDGEDILDDDDDYQNLKTLPKTKQRSTTKEDDIEEEELSDEEGWGADRADYFNADAIETEADALAEESEAKRLYQKQLKNMTEADFGFDEEFWTETRRDTTQARSTIEKLPEAQIAEGATTQQKLDILASRYPELQPLAEDFQHLQKVKNELDTVVAAEKSMKGETTLTSGLPAAVKRNALVAYLGAVSMYFAILASKPSADPLDRTITAMPPMELHEHAIIHSLARARELWERVENMETASLIPVVPPQKQPLPQSSALKSRSSMAEKALSKLPLQVDTLADRPKKKTSNKKPQASNGILTTNTGVETAETKKKDRKKGRSTNSSKKIDAKELQMLVSYTKRTIPANGVDNADESESNDSDLGEEAPLTASEAAEKQRKRKSLRFYTSQIAAKANRRGHASREAGGDDDLPYKERQRDRIQRLNKEAEARGRQEADNLNSDADGDIDGADIAALASELKGKRSSHGDVNDEYYDALFDAQERKKAQKRAKADAYAEAARIGGAAEVYEEETVGADGKRAITYAIAKNKGLAPRRKKEVRNPRVKKRKKFDEKMKKLGSIRQVYKGGEGKGGYGGELTGIKTNVVKSVKL